MAQFINAGPCALVLPDGTDVPRGGSCELSKKHLENKAIAKWVDDEWLTSKAGATTKKASAKKVDASKVTDATNATDATDAEVGPTSGPSDN